MTSPPQVNPNIRRDKWSPEEDEQLIALVNEFGVGRWAEIARQCDGRTDQQCMGRWRRHLDPNICRVSATTHNANQIGAYTGVPAKEAIAPSRALPACANETVLLTVRAVKHPTDCCPVLCGSLQGHSCVAKQ